MPVICLLMLAGCDRYPDHIDRIDPIDPIDRIHHIDRSHAIDRPPRAGMTASSGESVVLLPRTKVAMVVALPLPTTTTAPTVLQRLGNNGRATGVQLGTAGSLALPLSVSPADVVIASERNFFGGDRRRWSALSFASASNDGMLAGHGIVNGRALAWTWTGTLAVRHAAPAGTEIRSVVGPSDQGMFAVDLYVHATSERQIQSWQASGSRSLLYRNVQAKAGMQLFGMASNGLIGGIERDGLLLTLKLYDEQWRTLPFDYLACRCEARRVNARGQVLLSPLPDRGNAPYGYLVSRSGATLLPRVDPHTQYADLNNLGDVVGHGGGLPIVIFDGVLHDLNVYTDSGSTGWQFLTAVAINDHRQIIGTDLWRGQMRWYRLDLR